MSEPTQLYRKGTDLGQINTGAEPIDASMMEPVGFTLEAVMELREAARRLFPLGPPGENAVVSLEYLQDLYAALSPFEDKS